MGIDKVEHEVLDYLTWADFRLATEAIIAQIEDLQRMRNFKFKSIFGLPRGGLCLAVTLSYKLKLPLFIDEGKIDEHTLIVDDCTNTGKTLTEFMAGRNNHTATIFHKPKSYFVPTLYFRETENTVNYCWEHEDERN
jgi:uncharacterized protein